MKESIKNWRANNIKKGYCRYCKKKAVKGKTMCRYHLDYNKWHKKIYTRKKKKGGE